MSATECLLIRHAQSQPDMNVPEPLWPLSATGRKQALHLKDRLFDKGIQKIFSSPYPRAVDTVSPLADALTISIKKHDDLRERKLSEKMIDNWREELRKTWDDFNYHLPGGESNAFCQLRVTACLREILRESDGLTIAVSSHGNALALLMNTIDPAFRFAEWESMGNPHVFRIVYDGVALHWDRQFVL